MRFAFVQHGVVVEAWSRDPKELFDPGYAAQFVPCPDAVQAGWLYDGKGFSPPAPAPNPVPRAVTMRQARLQLNAQGLLDNIEAAIAGIADGAARKRAEIEWEYSQEVQRTHPLVNAILINMGMTTKQIDDLFRAAAQIS